MKTPHFFVLIAALAFSYSVVAKQALNVVSDNVIYNFDAQATGLMNYANGEIINVHGHQFDISEIDKITIGSEVIEQNTVIVNFDSEISTVTLPSDLIGKVTMNINGANVSLAVNESNIDIICVLQGKSKSGAFNLSGSKKPTILFNGAELTNPNGASISVEGAEQTILTIADETINMIYGTTSVVTITGDIVIEGEGTLKLYTTGDEAEAIHAASLSIYSGSLDVRTIGQGGVCISAEEITVNGGSLTARAIDSAMYSEGEISISGGSVNVISSNGDALSANGNINISGGTVVVFGGSANGCGLFVDEAKGSSVILKGGNLMSVGAQNCVPTPTSFTEQPYVSTFGSVVGGTQVTIAYGNNPIHTFAVPFDYSSSPTGTGPNGGNGGWGSNGGKDGSDLSIIISVPELMVGQVYVVRSGNATANTTARLYGLSNIER